MKSALRSRRSALAVTTGGRMEPVSRTVHHALGRLLAEDGDSAPQAQPEGSADADCREKAPNLALHFRKTQHIAVECDGPAIGRGDWAVAIAVDTASRKNVAAIV